MAMKDSFWVAVVFAGIILYSWAVILYTWVEHKIKRKELLWQF